MALSDMAIKKAKPREKIYTLKDADGLYLEIKPIWQKVLASPLLDRLQGKSSFPR